MSNNIGDYIRKYRGDLSLRDFAKKCGISHTHLDSIEKGFDPRTGKEVRVTVDTLKKIANAMGLTINELLTVSGEIEDDNDSIDKKKEYIKTIATDQNTGYSVQLLSDEPFNSLSKEEQEELIEMAMDQLYEMKRELKKDKK